MQLINVRGRCVRNLIISNNFYGNFPKYNFNYIQPIDTRVSSYLSLTLLPSNFVQPTVIASSNNSPTIFHLLKISQSNFTWPKMSGKSRHDGDRKWPNTANPTRQTFTGPVFPYSSSRLPGWMQARFERAFRKGQKKRKGKRGLK